MTDDEWRARAERGEWLEESAGLLGAPGTTAWVRWSGDWRLQVYRFGRGWEWEVRPPKGDPGECALGPAEDAERGRVVADLVCAALQRAALPVRGDLHPRGRAGDHRAGRRLGAHARHQDRPPRV